MKAGFPKSMLADMMEAIYLELSCLGRKNKQDIYFFQSSVRREVANSRNIDIGVIRIIEKMYE